MRLVFFLACLKSLLALPAAPLQNYCPVVIENNTGQDPGDVYFVAHGLDTQGRPCFLVPDSSSGICAYVYPDKNGANGSVESSRTLSQLPSATGTAASAPAYLIYLPINISSRGYISIQQPLFIETSSDPETGYIVISDPAVTSLNDPNYYTLYQDFEFGYDEAQVDSSTQIYLNLSWVDYFCLPMQLKTYAYPSNALIQINTPSFPFQVIPAGTNASLTREDVITAVNTALASYEQVPDTWSALGLLYYDNPYTDTMSNNYLRILAAKNSLSFGSSGVKFVGAASPQVYFPADYASDSNAGPSPGTSYMQAAYNYYAAGGHSLSAQIKPAGINDLVYTITSVTTGSGPANLTLQFVTAGIADRNVALDLSTLSTEQLLSGSVWPFYPLGGSDQVDAAISNELSKLISALFTVGQFPFTAYSTTVANPFLNNNQGYETLTYFSNPTGFAGGPWWNGYSRALHLQMISKGVVPNNPTLGTGYAYDFDDLLNMSGLIAGINIQNSYGNPSTDTSAPSPYVLITMESLEGTTIPNIAQDAYTYNVTMGPAANGMDVSFTYYDGDSTQTTAAQKDANTVLGSVTVDADHPFLINFSYDGGDDHSFSINLLRQVVTPYDTTAFSGLDRKYQSSINFSITNSPPAPPEFFITYDSSPPPWSQ